MNLLADNMRARAKELDAAFQQEIKEKNVDVDLVRVIKAAVVPELMLALADTFEVLENQEPLDGQMARLQKFAKRNQAVREAAASGDWDAIDRILSNGIGGGAEGNTDGSDSGEVEV